MFHVMVCICSAESGTISRGGPVGGSVTAGVDFGASEAQARPRCCCCLLSSCYLRDPDGELASCFYTVYFRQSVSGTLPSLPSHGWTYRHNLSSPALPGFLCGGWGSKRSAYHYSVNSSRRIWIRLFQSFLWGSLKDSTESYLMPVCAVEPLSVSTE